MKEKQKKKKKSHIPVRMNILFFSVFLMFSILILRLGVMQIVQGEEYRREVEKKNVESVDFSVPRGEIYDRYYQKVVSNIPLKAVTFTPPTNPKPLELLEIAFKLDEYIEMDETDKKKVTSRDKKDLWLLLNDNGNDLVTEEELQNLSDKEIYQLKLDRITEENLETIDLNVAAIYIKLYRAMALTPTIVKKGVTEKEFALISENLDQLPGVDVTTDWDREKLYGKVMSTVLGSFGDMPLEEKDYYLAKGYSLSDRVGTSYIEELYEDVLRGTKSVVRTVTDKAGNVIETEVVSEGESGKDIVLTIDMEFQAMVEQIIEEEILKMKTYPYTDTLDKAFVVAMDPMTGEILALAGKQYNEEDEEFWEFSQGTFTQAFEMGSSIKGATMLAAYDAGVISIGSVYLDEIMYLPGGIIKSSVNRTAMGYVNDLKALERSSNVYMFKAILDMMDGTFVQRTKFTLDPDKMPMVRNYYAQFGLGVSTGIGFQNEETGIIADLDPAQLGNYIDIGIGQLDTYTPLQLAQYISTIANGGYRMKPMLIKEIREPDPEGLGNIVYQFQPEVLNKLTMDEKYIERVQQGLWQVTHGSQGTARGVFANEPYNAAGKTGSAETFHAESRQDAVNSTFVAYAPFVNPEIALAVVVPTAYTEKMLYPINQMIAQRVFRAYFELQQTRNISDDALDEYIPEDSDIIEDTEEKESEDNIPSTDETENEE